MTTYILNKNNIEAYYDLFIKNIKSKEEILISISLMGLQEKDIDEAKIEVEIGDCLLLEYDNKILPF